MLMCLFIYLQNTAINVNFIFYIEIATLGLAFGKWNFVALSGTIVLLIISQPRSFVTISHLLFSYGSLIKKAVVNKWQFSPFAFQASHWNYISIISAALRIYKDDIKETEWLVLTHSY